VLALGSLAASPPGSEVAPVQKSDPKSILTVVVTPERVEVWKKQEIPIHFGLEILKRLEPTTF
jgi:hypothetical protein